jgi:ribosomal protein S15P/S13E
MYFILTNSSFKDFSLQQNLYRVMADIRALMRLALQIQFPILLPDFDQNDKGSTAVRGYYIPNLMAIRSTILDYYMRTDRLKYRSILTATPVGMRTG